MALRVLLADESSTIKKVMQLALQDFGVEVKSVPIGLDVVQVSRSYQPDIIFADVLLSKRSGYDVAIDVKGDPGLRSIPVVLMWSGFMELDEARARACGAERRLEKPFDADHLRQLVRDLVPRLNENKISNYLTFPDLPDIVETPMEETSADSGTVDQDEDAPSDWSSPPPSATSPSISARGPQARGTQSSPMGQMPRMSQPQPQAPRPTPSGAKGPGPTIKPPHLPPRDPKAPVRLEPEFQKPKPRATPAATPPPITDKEDTAFGGYVQLNSDLDDPDDFQQIPLPGSRTKNIFEQREEEEWRQGGLEQFRVTPEADFNEAPDGLMDLTSASMAMTDGVENVSIDELEDLTSAHAYSEQQTERRPETHSRPTSPPRSTPSRAPQSRTFNTGQEPSAGMGFAGLDPVRAEEVLREQVREVLESIAWKIIPDIAERIVREEIQRIMKEAERLS